MISAASRPVVIDGSPPYTIATRHTDSGTPIQKATQYVGEHLAGLGLPVEYHRGGMQTRPPNVIGQITGEATPSQIFLIGAHLDDMPQYPYAQLRPAPTTTPADQRPCWLLRTF